MALAFISEGHAQQEATHIDALVGNARLERLGAQPQLVIGTVITERDQLEVEPGSALRLSFAPGTFLELGGDGRLALEKIPMPSLDVDRNAILSLAQGDLHLHWKPGKIAETADWRVVVYFGAQHAVLIPGDYYFSVTDTSQLACVAEGKLEVISTSNARIRTAIAHRCYSSQTGQAGRIEPAEPRAWGQVIAALKPLERSPPAVPTINEVPVIAVSTQELPKATPTTPIAQPQATSSSPTPAKQMPVASKPQNWALNLATLADRAAAEKLAAQMTAAAYPAIIKAAVIDGKTFYRVQITGFTSAESARAIEPELAQKFGLIKLWPTQQAP